MEARRPSTSLTICAAGMALALACGRQEGGDASGEASAPPAGDSPVVARLNGEPLTIADLRGGFPGAMGGNPGHALDTAVARRLAAQEAGRRGLDATSTVQAQIEALRREAAAREEALLRDALQASHEAELVIS